MLVLPVARIAAVFSIVSMHIIALRWRRCLARCHTPVAAPFPPRLRPCVPSSLAPSPSHPVTQPLSHPVMQLPIVWRKNALSIAKNRSSFGKFRKVSRSSGDAQPRRAGAVPQATQDRQEGQLPGVGLLGLSGGYLGTHYLFPPFGRAAEAVVGGEGRRVGPGEGYHVGFPGLMPPDRPA